MKERQEKTSIYGDKNQYQNAIKLVEQATISQNNKNLILDYDLELMSDPNISEKRRTKIMWLLRNVSYYINKDLDKVDVKDIKELMRKLNTNTYRRIGRNGQEVGPERRYKPSTISDYCKLIKRFYKWLDKKNYETLVGWINTKYDKRKIIKGSDLITLEDVKKLSEVCDNPKDLAFINFLYESGGRIAEILNMTLNDITFNERYCKVRLNGKTGERFIIITHSTTYLKQYLNCRNSESNYFWISASDKNKGSRLRYAGAVMLVRKLVKRANLNKKHNLHHWRHSRATELASFLTEPEMRKYFGWSATSDTPATYVHLSGRDVENKMLERSGLLDEKEKKILNKICSICNTSNNPTLKHCSKCGYALSVKDVISFEKEVENKINDVMSSFFSKVKDDPSVLEKFEEFKKNKVTN